MINKLTLVFGILFLFSFASVFAEEVNVAEELEIIETDMHSSELWFGACKSCGVTDWANQSLTAFNCTSGIGYYGGIVKLVGDDDLIKFNTTYTYADLHRIYFNGSTIPETWRVRLIWGTACETNKQACINSGNYSDIMVSIDETFKGYQVGTPMDMQMPRISTRDNIHLYADCWATSAGRIDFFVGGHFYGNDTYTSDITADLTDEVDKTWFAVGLAIISVLLMWLSGMKLIGVQDKELSPSYLSINDGFNKLFTAVLRITSIGLFLIVSVMAESGFNYSQVSAGTLMFLFVIYMFCLFLDRMFYIFAGKRWNK